jgi:arylsulfatase A-like enzyme
MRLTRALASICALLLAACGGGPEGSPARPNLLLISVDCLRADHVGCYGYERDTTPGLDKFARQGVRFERCISSSSWTLPAHLSMLTGLPVSGHGVDDDRLWSRVDGQGQPLDVPLRGVFVSEVLKAAGYATAGFYTWTYLEPRFGFGPGFDVYERLAHNFYSHPTVAPRFEALRAANDVAGMKALAAEYPALFDDTTPSAPEVVDRAVQWIDGLHEDGEQPFFLFLHVFDAHDPYTPPAPFDRMFDPDYTGDIDGRRVTSGDSPVRRDMDPRDLQHLVARYDGAIRFVDKELSRLFEALEQRDLTENTLVIVTGDHGEEFFEHGAKTHRNQLYLESVGVPLLMRWPAALPAGRVVEGNAGLVDLVPTLAAAAGVELPRPTMGVNLLPFARDEATNDARPYLSELSVFDQGSVPRRLVSITRGNEQRLLSTRGKQAWSGLALDLGTDPLGRGWGTPTQDVEFDRLRQALARLREAQPARDGTTPLDSNAIEGLAAMGYAGAGEAIEGVASEGDRLVIDGGVWPDE